MLGAELPVAEHVHARFSVVFYGFLVDKPENVRRLGSYIRKVDQVTLTSGQGSKLRIDVTLSVKGGVNAMPAKEGDERDSRHEITNNDVTPFMCGVSVDIR